MANCVKLIPLEIITNRVKNLIKYATPILGENKIGLIDALTAIDYIKGSVEYYNALWHKLRMCLSTSHPTLFPIHRYRINRIPYNQDFRKYPWLKNSFYGTYSSNNSTSAVEPYSISTYASFEPWNVNLGDDVGQTTFANFNTY